MSAAAHEFWRPRSTSATRLLMNSAIGSRGAASGKSTLESSPYIPGHAQGTKLCCASRQSLSGVPVGKQGQGEVGVEIPGRHFDRLYQTHF